MDNEKKVISIKTLTAYLEVAKSEYELERDKKQSFENRVGIILTVVGAICIFLLEKVQMRDLINLALSPMTFIIFLKIISGTLVYLSFILTLIALIKTINVRLHNNFFIENVKEDRLQTKSETELYAIFTVYQDIIRQHRALNEKRASTYRWSLFGMLTVIICTIIYISL